jgi:DNA repair protein RadB
VQYYTGNSELDKYIEESLSILFYGPAAAGKTTLLLTIAGELCKLHPCVYVSTEETLHYERVAKYPDKYEKALFTEAYDYDELLKTAIAVSALKPRYVFIDSINSLFRLEALKEGSVEKLAFITSLLLETVERNSGKLFASAQVRSSEAGEVEASGIKILDYYFDLIVSILIDSENKRILRVIKFPVKAIKEAIELKFAITESGVVWYA